MSSHIYRSLDQFDIFLLVAISTGVNSCVYLANSTGNSKQMVSVRVQVLEKYGLIEIKDTNQKHFTKEYCLTPIAQDLVASMYFDVNSNYLQKLKETKSQKVV